MENMRHWLVTDAGRPAPWHVVTSEAVADELRADDAARVEGPFVRADAYQGAVQALEALTGEQVEDADGYGFTVSSSVREYAKATLAALRGQ